MAEKSISSMIDIFCHVMPERYRQALYKKARGGVFLEAHDKLDAHHDAIPALFDLELRFRMMDRFEGMRQVLSIAAPPLEAVAAPADAVDLAKLANDDLAELIAKYPDRFVAGVACLPMNDMDAALLEAERALGDLRLKGVQVYTPTQDKPLDNPEFLPLYEMMARYELPIWLHPIRGRDVPDYKTESFSKYRLFHIFGWPYETTTAMARLVFSGILDKYPNLQFITHHCGGMVPYFSERLAGQGQRMADQIYVENALNLNRPPIEYFKMFYGDTALGSTAGLMCGYAFFGADHMVFGTDMPFGGGVQQMAEAIRSVEEMAVTEQEKLKIFNENAKRILHLAR